MTFTVNMLFLKVNMSIHAQTTKIFVLPLNKRGGDILRPFRTGDLCQSSELGHGAAQELLRPAAETAQSSGAREPMLRAVALAEVDEPASAARFAHHRFSRSKPPELLGLPNLRP